MIAISNRLPSLLNTCSTTIESITINIMLTEGGISSSIEETLKISDTS